jgi:hypothetical protein
MGLVALDMTRPMIQEIFGERCHDILVWAVGDDYSTITWQEWPARITANTGISVSLSDKIDATCREIRRAFEDRVQTG